MIIDDGHWWSLMIIDDHWWPLMIIDDHWWSLIIIDGYWWLLMIIDDQWWSLMSLDVVVAMCVGPGKKFGCSTNGVWQAAAGAIKKTITARPSARMQPAYFKRTGVTVAARRRHGCSSHARNENWRHRGGPVTGVDTVTQRRRCLHQHVFSKSQNFFW